MSKEEYENEFGKYRQLLVLKRGQVVVAATSGNDRMGLASEFLEQYPEDAGSLLMFVTGPMGMRENLHGGGIPTPSPRGNSR